MCAVCKPKGLLFSRKTGIDDAIITGRKRSSSPHSPGPGKKAKQLNPNGQSLLQLWTARKLREAQLMHKEFAGRQV